MPSMDFSLPRFIARTPAAPARPGSRVALGRARVTVEGEVREAFSGTATLIRRADGTYHLAILHGIAAGPTSRVLTAEGRGTTAGARFQGLYTETRGGVLRLGLLADAGDLTVTHSAGEQLCGTVAFGGQATGAEEPLTVRATFEVAF